MAAPAGWYPDPDGSGGQQYFDGRFWTDQRAPATAVEARSLAAVQAAARVSGSNLKVIAGVIAAVVVLVIVGVAAVVMTLKTDVGDSTVTHRPSDASSESSVVAEELETGVAAPTLEDQAWSVGQPVRDGNFEFQADDEAWIYLGNTLADLNPGDSIDTAVVFDVPVGTDPESIELHDGPFSEGVTVGL